MKTKSGKSHWKCTTIRVSARCGKEVNENFRFVAFDGVLHMERIKKDYAAHGVLFEYTDLVNMDAD